MSGEIKLEVLNDIADSLEIGLICFYHKITGEVESYPQTIEDIGDVDGFWEEVTDKIEENYSDFVRIECMNSSEAFDIMEDFAVQINEVSVKSRFLNALSHKKPFQNFNHTLHYYPALREEWFKFKRLRYIEYVKDVLTGAGLIEDNN